MMVVALLVTAAVHAPVAAATTDPEGPRAARSHHRELLAESSGPSTLSSGIDFKKDYPDPASDVMLLNGTTGEPAVVNGSYVLGGEPKDVNIKWVRSREAANNTTVEVSLELVGGGEIVDLENTTYTFNLYTDVTNRSRHLVNYSNGAATLRSNVTSESADLSGNVTISGPNPQKQNTLTVAVRKALLKNLSAWNIYATARQVGSPHSHQDFGWEVPGNPGSTPTPPPAPPPSPLQALQSWLPCIVAGLLVLAIVVAVVLLTRRKKRGVEPAKPGT